MPKEKERLSLITTLDGRFYVVESDILIPEAGIDTFLAERQQHADRYRAGMVRKETARLIAATDRYGQPQKWDAMPLTYNFAPANEHADFTPEERGIVCAALARACEDWSAVCNVQIVQVASEVPATFVVMYLDTGGDFIAAAFFPNDPPALRKLYIDPCYFEPDLGFDRVGVLRHELGHVLGFRHEHISPDAPPSCPEEGGGSLSLTPYDSKSVMHYLCGGVGSPDLAITDVDRKGAQKIYGPPQETNVMVETAVRSDGYR